MEVSAILYLIIKNSVVTIKNQNKAELGFGLPAIIMLGYYNFIILAINYNG